MSRFVLKVFFPEVGKVIAIDEDTLVAKGTDVSTDLGGEEETLYREMRKHNIDMAHRPSSSGGKQEAESAAPGVRVFGTFYVNLGAFKKAP